MTHGWESHPLEFGYWGRPNRPLAVATLSLHLRYGLSAENFPRNEMRVRCSFITRSHLPLSLSPQTKSDAEKQRVSGEWRAVQCSGVKSDHKVFGSVDGAAAMPCRLALYDSLHRATLPCSPGTKEINRIGRQSAPSEEKEITLNSSTNM